MMGRMGKAMAVGVLGVATAATAQGGATSQYFNGDPLHIWVGNPNAAQAREWADAHLAAAQTRIETLLAVKGPRTVENTLREYDEAKRELDLAGSGASLLTNASPNKDLRDVGDEMQQKVSAAATALSLNPEVYHALEAVDAAAADTATRYYLEHTLLEYRLSGIDKDAATRERVRKLSDELTAETLHFQRNIAESQGRVVVKDKAQLDGLPADYVARHAAGADGKIVLTTDEPDYRPVMTYAKSEDLRQRMYLAYNGRAYPANEELLQQVLKTRAELAQELGFANWAELATADKLIKNPANVRSAAGGAGQGREAGCDEGVCGDSGVCAEAPAGVDGDSGVQRGVLDGAVSARGVWVRFAGGAGVLSVSRGAAGSAGYGGATIPREVCGGEGAGTVGPVGRCVRRDGCGWEQREEAGADLSGYASAGREEQVVQRGHDGDRCRGPAVAGGAAERELCGRWGGCGDPGLMQYCGCGDVLPRVRAHDACGAGLAPGVCGDVVVQRGVGFCGGAVADAGGVLPRQNDSWIALRRTTRRARCCRTICLRRCCGRMRLGAGLDTSGRLRWRTTRWNCTTARRSKVNIEAMWKQATIQGSPWQWVDGNYGFATFTHLMGYSSNYYTYSLSKVIALDFFNQFDKKNLLDGPAAMRYRKTVLEPGGSMSANDLVKNFLGRPQSYEAFKAWMNEEFAGAK